MPTNSPSTRFRDLANLPFETFIVSLTVIPILVLIYFYPMLPERVPEYLNLRGEVEVWGHKGLASVFRLPLMAIDLQVLCLLTEYGAWQTSRVQQDHESHASATDHRKSLDLSIRLLQWFRAFIAIKLGASSLEVIFFSIERFHFLTTVTRVASWAASVLGVLGAAFYSYRLLMLNRGSRKEVEDARIRRQADKSHWHWGLFYYNSGDPAWFTDGYRLNLANKWIYVFLACLLLLPLLMFWPMLSS